eukprot:TRINITY_DN2250_c0_g1_i2.p1 TRINITY_DN2250_c0_g1~~TRINITY_DN2250_c0_g1_i2.p1  ORF type:complete len:364 (+),score=76.22 TRINITY_DN2250_c0_g1_i2:471-1562(+)
MSQASDLSTAAQQLRGRRFPDDSLDQAYKDIYEKYADLMKGTEGKEGQESARDEILVAWAQAYKQHAGARGDARLPADDLYLIATNKLTEAIPTSQEAWKLHFVASDLLYDEAMYMKHHDNKSKADALLTSARDRLQQALSIKPDYVEALDQLSVLFQEQSALRQGNEQMWFVGQAKDATRQADAIRAGEQAPRQGPTPEAKFEIASQEKEKGNQYFKTGDLQKAMFHYHSCLNYLNGLFGLPPAMESKITELKVTVWNNMATVHLKQGKSERAIEKLDKVLAASPQNLKALFRRGKAHLGLNDIDRARTDLTQAQSMAPADAEITRELAMLERKAAQQAKKQSGFYARMFDKMGQDEANPSK